MARTLIGQLILRLRAQGLGEAKKVKEVMRDIEDSARALGKTGTPTWGIGFQRQIDKLKLAGSEIREVEKSWAALHKSMKRRDLSGALKRAEIGHWKTNTISVLAQARSEMDRHFQMAERAARGHAKNMQNILKPALVMMGAYTAPYLFGVLGNEALTASSERRREIYRQRMAGIPEGDRNKLYDRSEEIGKKYPSVPITGIMELSRGAYSVMGDADRAAAVLERMAQALVVMQSARGSDAAAGQLIGLIRGLDNLGVNKNGQIGIDQVNEMIDAATRAAQVDPDFDPEKFFQFARATKVAGPALSMDFLTRAPAYIQDSGDGATGNALAMAFKAFVLEAVGSAGGKRYLEERDRIGIRKNNKLVDSEMFGANPDEWVLKHLVPALQKDGVDLDNETQVAAAVGKLSGNSTATGFMTRVITQRAQVERWLKMMDHAMGTDKADEVRAEDPFVGWESFKKSLENLAAAMVPIDAINVGLNALADGFNKLAAAAKDNPWLTALGMGMAGVGAYEGGKFAAGKVADLFGLKASAVALDGSAAALTRAAVALGGAGVADGMPGGPKSKGPGLFMSLAPWLAAAGGIWSLFDQGDGMKNAPRFHLGADDLMRWYIGADEKKPRKDLTPGYTGSETQLTAQRGNNYNPLMQAVDSASALGNAVEASRAAGQEMQQNLSVTASPSVDTSALERALSMARALKAELLGIGAAAANAERKVGAEMRRNFSDTGGGGGF